MSLNARILLGLSAVMLLFAVAIYGVQRQVVMPSFEKLERDEAIEDLRRCEDLLRNEVAHLDTFLTDWSEWDDSYAFVSDKNQAYIAANLRPQTFTSSRLNLIAFVDVNGTFVWREARDPETQEPVALDLLTAPSIPRNHPLLRLAGAKSAVSGVLLTERGPMLVASRPILRTDGTGPARGALVMGRFLRQGNIEWLQQQAGVELRLWPIQPGGVPEEERPALEELAGGAPLLIRRLDVGVLRLYKLLPDIFDKAGLLIRADVHGDILQVGMASARATLCLDIAAVLLALLMLAVMLRRMVVHPILGLSSCIKYVRENNDLSPWPPSKRSDEIGVLSQEFDLLLNRLNADNSRRQQAEDALRDSEAHLQAILNAAPDGIVTIDASGVIRSANPAAARMLQSATERLMGRRLSDLLPSPQTSGDAKQICVADCLDDDNAGGSQSGREVEVVRGDGSTFIAYFSVSRVSAASGDLRIAVMRDITDLKRLHEEMARARHLAMIGEMSASIAHEIKNPLAGISGAIQVLRDRTDRSDSHARVFDDILDQVKRLDQAAHNLLGFAKAWTPNRRCCSLAELARAAWDSVQKRESVRSVRFLVEDPASVMVFCDPLLLEQVLTNLFLNAIHAMPDGGTLRCESSDSADTVRIDINDTGAGMTAEILERARQPFFTTRMRGTGLGLSICARIVEAHDGTLDLSSAPGQGTRVTIILPKERKPAIS